MEKSCEVVLDTNFLTLPQQFRIDVLEEVKSLVPNADIVTLESVVEELVKLKEGKVGMAFIEQGRVRVVPWSSETTDKAIIEYALENDAIVATNDKELKEQLRKLSVPVIQMREKRKLELQGVVKDR